MEFQEAIKTMRPSSARDRNGSSSVSVASRFPWKFSFHRSSKSASSSPTPTPTQTPTRKQHSVPSRQNQKQAVPVSFPSEFLCPISGHLMIEPVIVSSGQSFDRASVDACKSVGFVPTTLIDGTTPDFSAVIPNLALKSAILSYCKGRSIQLLPALDMSSLETIIGKLAADAAKTNESPASLGNKELSFSSSNEPSGTTSSTGSPSTTANGGSPVGYDEDVIISKLKSPQIFEIEETVAWLRNLSRSREDCRASLCTPRLLNAIRLLIVSKYSEIQVNTVALVVNLSLEKANKVGIVRSGILPNLILVLKSGSLEAQEHAAAAIFSLALDDHNKIAIGVLGALPPLVDILRTAGHRAQNDAALALYHLSLIQTNCIKLNRIGAVQVLLGLLRSGRLMEPALLLICNMAAFPDGRTTLLDTGATKCLLGMLDRGELKTTSAQDNCLNALLALSQMALRFKGLAKASGAIEILEKMETKGSKNKASLLLSVITERTFEEEEEEVDWEKLLESGPPSPRLSFRAG